MTRKPRLTWMYHTALFTIVALYAGGACTPTAPKTEGALDGAEEVISAEGHRDERPDERHTPDTVDTRDKASHEGGTDSGAQESPRDSTTTQESQTQDSAPPGDQPPPRDNNRPERTPQESPSDAPVNPDVPSERSGSPDVTFPDVSGSCTTSPDCGTYSCQTSGQDCMQFIPACALGSCALFSRLVKGATCSSEGVCQRKPCTSNADCGTPGCRNRGAACLTYQAICESGFCNPYERQSPGQICDRVKNTCVVGLCQTNADCGKPRCEQSKYCVQFTPSCLNGACSEKPEIKLNQQCNKQTGLCGNPKSCTKDSDCGTSTCQTAGTLCSQTKVFCNASRQCETTLNSYTGYTCQPSTGQCTPNKCTKDSDCDRAICSKRDGICEQGTSTCQNGICIRKVERRHSQVCDSMTCSPEKSCSKATDCGTLKCVTSPSYIPGRTLCVELQPSCAKGACELTPDYHYDKVCDQTTGHCKPKACQKDADCGNRYCSVNQNGGCNQQTPHCFNGGCIYPNYFLDKSGCNSQQLCTNQCQSNVDCGNSSCKDEGLDCVQVVPICRSGSCAGTFRFVKHAICSPNQGTCLPRKACQKDADCGSTSCYPTKPNAPCIETTPTCEQGVCIDKSSSKPGHTCNGSVGICQPSNTCKANSDCGQASCTTSGSNCNFNQPTCDLQSGACFSTYSPHFGSTCNTTTSQCEGNACQTDSACGSSQCRDEGVDCREYVVSCQSGKCNTKESLIKASICDKTKGRCQRCTQDSDCGQSSCREIGVQCLQDIPTCDQGRCTTTGLSGPGTCTSSTGLCRFSSTSP